MVPIVQTEYPPEFTVYEGLIKPIIEDKFKDYFAQIPEDEKAMKKVFKENIL